MTPQYVERWDGQLISVIVRGHKTRLAYSWMEIQSAERVRLTHPDIAGAVHEAGDVGYIVDLGVEPDARRQGIGREMVRRLVALASKRGLSVVYVYAMTVTGVDPVPFYLACEFRQVRPGQPYMKMVIPR